MPGKYEAPRKKQKIPVFLWLFFLVLVFLMLMRLVEKKPVAEITATVPPETAREEIPSAEETETEPVVIDRAVVAVQGDLLMHATFFQEKYNPVCRNADGSLDFTSLFRYVREYVARADYAVANLETTLGGDAFPYQGNPSFNCPDPILDAVRSAGYDMLLTANNHSYDTLMQGIDRTLEQVRGKGLDTLGTRLSEEEPRFRIKQINGIRIGMVSYTYTMTMRGGKPQLNDNSPVEKPEQINYFSYDDLNGFYEEIRDVMDQMREQGAEATMLFIHWGTEYEITQNGTQEKIAQKMCDMGFDVIVGGHPHVVQPMALLQSNQDPAHQTVCIYSLGNAISNQRRDLMRLKTGHTEDGALFTVTFEKHPDGRVYVADTDVLPTWVHLYETDGGKMEYNILPLDIQRQDQWMEQFGVSQDVYQELLRSHQRTMNILEPGLLQCKNGLNEKNALLS